MRKSSRDDVKTLNLFKNLTDLNGLYHLCVCVCYYYSCINCYGPVYVYA